MPRVGQCATARRHTGEETRFSADGRQFWLTNERTGVEQLFDIGFWRLRAQLRQWRAQRKRHDRRHRQVHNLTVVTRMCVTSNALGFLCSTRSWADDSALTARRSAANDKGHVGYKIPSALDACVVRIALPSTRY